MKQTLTLFFTFFGVFVLSAQNIGLNDTIVFYSEYESLMNMEKKSWTEGTNFDSIKTITALKIWNIDQLQFFLKNKNKWQAEIYVSKDEQKRYLGLFETELEAVRVYNREARRIGKKEQDIV